MIGSKIGEPDITDAVMYILLDEKAAGREWMNMTDLRISVKAFLRAGGENLQPLANRPDDVIDQVIRNIVSNRGNTTNIVHKGLLEYNSQYGLRITERGKQYLKGKMRNRFETELG